MKHQISAKLTTGSIYQHVIKMSLAASIGLASIFLVDLADIYFLSLLNMDEITAAVGFGGSILFFTTSMSIGFAILMTALVSRSIGALDKTTANRWMTNVYALTLIVSIPVAVVVYIFTPSLLRMIGAHGLSLELGESYLRILIPSVPIFSLAITSGSVLRALGDAKRAMYSTIGGAVVNAILDPIFIFNFNLGIEGAAYASFLARIAVFFIAFMPLKTIYKMHIEFNWIFFKKDLKPMLSIFFPAVLTNLATPIGNAYVMYAIADFGESAVAGISVIGRLTPVAFSVVYASSGAVGPIIGQNYGANLISRVQETITKTLQFILYYVIISSIVLWLLADSIADSFGLDSEGKYLVVVFCKYLSFTFFMNGAIFVSNAAYNNLGNAKMSTYVNFAKATFFTIPFVYYGALYYGAVGIIVGQAVGASIIGTIAILYAYNFTNNLKPN
jgi:putative MATE family efflux protein